MSQTYSDKLKDPRWQRRRLEVMKRDEFQCVCCGDDKSTLNVHHLEYNRNPWDTPIEKLETLCGSCHEARSKFNKKIAALPTGFALDFINQAADCTCGELADMLLRRIKNKGRG